MEIEARNEGGGARENLLGGRGEVCVRMCLRERERERWPGRGVGVGAGGTEIRRGEIAVFFSAMIRCLPGLGTYATGPR